MLLAGDTPTNRQLRQRLDAHIALITVARKLTGRCFQHAAERRRLGHDSRRLTPTPPPARRGGQPSMICDQLPATLLLPLTAA